MLRWKNEGCVGGEEPLSKGWKGKDRTKVFRHLSSITKVYNQSSLSLGSYLPRGKWGSGLLFVCLSVGRVKIEEGNGLGREVGVFSKVSLVSPWR